MANEISRARNRASRTLVVDIGASGIKAVVLDIAGRPISDRTRMKTPSPATPVNVLQALCDLAGTQPEFDRIAIGFPGVVRNGVIETAANLHRKWRGVDLAKKLQSRLRKPVRVINDADLQGFGAISGYGVELVITLGTGFGSALFVDGRLVPNLEVGLYPFDGKTYQKMLGDAARKKVGSKKWNKRLSHAIKALDEVFNYDRLYVGGGNSKKIKLRLPLRVRVVPNEVALRGGIALWEG